MDVNIEVENSNDRINISATTTVVPIYHGKKVHTTIGGKTIIRWISVIHDITISIQYMPNENYFLLRDIIESVNPLLITTEENNKYRAVFTDDRLNLIKNIDADGNIYWTGSLNFKES